MNDYVEVNLINPLVKSRVSGDFYGWNGNTEVQLINGQVWKQVKHYHKNKHKHAPRAFVFREGGRYKMVVEGISKPVSVERVQ